MFLVDSHCHLGDLKFRGVDQDLDQVLAAAGAAGVTHMLCICTDLPTFPGMYEKVKDLDHVYATVGLHPLNLDTPWDEAKFMEYVSRKKIVAIGEIGMDYHYESGSSELQKKVFARQLELALQLDLPVIIHSREAPEDTWSVLESVDPQRRLRGVFHCYADSLEHAKQVLERGFYISVSGIVTFPQAHNIRELAGYIPLDRLLVETDSPYMAPVPHRGKRNESSFVTLVVEKLAECYGVSKEHVAEQTTRTASHMFLDVDSRI